MLEIANNTRLRNAAKRMPGLRLLYQQLRERKADAREVIDTLRLRAATRRPFQSDPSSNVIVSLTSFPARIDKAWIAIETIFQQTMPPAKVVLVLAEQEFPNRHLPRMIRQQQQRGLEILWVKRNSRSYIKLLPTRAAYPDARIVTVDDDLFYRPCTLEQLVSVADENPGAIIGQRGWVIAGERARLEPYINWVQADRSTPSGWVFLTGVGGVLYPPGTLDEGHLFDIDLAEELCPTADDIWFWAMAKLSGTPLICLGNNGTRSVRRLQASPRLETINREGGENDVQLQNVIDHFDLSSCI